MKWYKATVSLWFLRGLPATHYSTVIPYSGYHRPPKVYSNPTPSIFQLGTYFFFSDESSTKRLQKDRCSPHWNLTLWCRESEAQLLTTKLLLKTVQKLYSVSQLISSEMNHKLWWICVVMLVLSVTLGVSRQMLVSLPFDHLQCT